MDRVYYENQYIREFKAEIVEIKNKDGRYHIILDKTAFFPGGGGQFCDLGTIGDQEVKEVYEECGHIYHVVENKPCYIKNVNCILDFERRKDGMHQHLGQHIISGCFFKMYNANTVSFHLGKEISTVDIVGDLNEYQIREVEKFANKVIEENMDVECFVPSKDKLEGLSLRRALPKTSDDIRVVKIGNLDINACCGVHPKSTIELRLIKIKRWEKNKGATRIEFLSGKRAIEYSLKTDKYLNEVCRYLSTNEVEVLNRVKNLNKEVKTISDKNKKLNDDMAIYEVNSINNSCENTNGIKIVKKLFVEADMKYINKIIKELVSNESTVAIIGNENEGNINLMYAASKNFNLIGMDELIKDTLKLINGKGGGNNKLAQGFGKSFDGNGILNTAVEKISRLSSVIKD